VRIDSARGKGTVVTLCFPAASAAAIAPQPEPAAARTEAAGAVAGEVVLVVEDDPEVRKLSCMLVDRMGYRVLSASDGPSALEILDEAGRIDLLFTDVVLPGGMSGADLAEQARERDPSLKVLYTSGYAANHLPLNVGAAEGVELISKPYRKQELAHKIREILDRAPAGAVVHRFRPRAERAAARGGA
ncbi:MAG: response regulator, partial [Alphaproteobacteria bacterium]